MVGLEKITNRILSDARLKADDIIKEAEATCDGIWQESDAVCDEIRERIESEAVAECENIKSRSISAMAMYRRDKLMNVRVRMLDRAFAKAKDDLLSMEPDKYKELLASLLRRVLEEQVESEKESMRLYGEDTSPEAYEVIMNRTDRESYGVYVIAGVRRGTIGKITGDILQKVHLSENVADISGGIILKCGDIEINSSFDTMLSELRPEIEAEVEAELGRYIELYDEQKDDSEEEPTEDEVTEDADEITEVTDVSDESEELDEAVELCELESELSEETEELEALEYSDDEE